MHTVKRDKMIRVNTRIREDQDAYIKAKALKEGRYEGDVTRDMLDEYIKNHPINPKK